MPRNAWQCGFPANACALLVLCKVASWLVGNLAYTNQLQLDLGVVRVEDLHV